MILVDLQMDILFGDGVVLDRVQKTLSYNIRRFDQTIALELIRSALDAETSKVKSVFLSSMIKIHVNNQQFLRCHVIDEDFV
tara:strand:- start:626 stop:871 length:246 start_codon:yes stop_codon:yes gene_type:complete